MTSPKILVRGIVSLLALSVGASAADNFWVGATSSDWNTASNWSLGTVPGGGDNAHVDVNGTGAFRAAITANVPTVVDILVSLGGLNANSPGILNHSAGSISTGGGNWIDVGSDGGNGIYNLANASATGGTLTGMGVGSGSVTGYRLYVGGVEFGANRGTGTFNMNTSGTLSTANDFLVGVHGGTGVFNLDAGTVNTGTGGGWNFIGTEKGLTGGDGTLNMSGGTITAVSGGRTYVGDGNAVGRIVMSGGTYNNTGDYTAIGNNNLANPTASSISMSGGTYNAGNFYVGGNNDSAGKGTATVNGATALINAGGEIWVGDKAGSNGTMTVSSGTVQGSNWIAIGRDGATGVLNLSGGAINKLGANTSHFILGSLGGNGTINQTGGAINVAGHGEIRIGEGASTALWDMSGGTANTDNLALAWSGGTSEVRVRGTAALTAGSINIGSNGSGILNQSGGTVTSNAWVAMGVGSTIQAQYNLSGGTLNATNNVEVGADSAGALNLSGSGVINAPGIESPSRNGAGVFNITGGTLNTATIMLGGRDGSTLGSGLVNQSGGVVNVSGLLDVQRLAVGTGTYSLSGGTLSVDGSVDLSNGTFNFTGGKITRSTPGAILLNGNLALGSPTAGFKLNADKTFQVGGVFDITSGITLDLAGMIIPAYSGTGAMTGSFTLGGDLSILGTFTTATTTIQGLVNTPGATFVNEAVGEGATFNAATQSVYWVQENAGAVTLKYSVVPEPGSLSLLAVAGLGLAARRRRASSVRA